MTRRGQSQIPRTTKRIRVVRNPNTKSKSRSNSLSACIPPPPLPSSLFHTFLTPPCPPTEPPTAESSEARQQPCARVPEHRHGDALGRGASGRLLCRFLMSEVNSAKRKKKRKKNDISATETMEDAMEPIETMEGRETDGGREGDECRKGKWN